MTILEQAERFKKALEGAMEFARKNIDLKTISNAELNKLVYVYPQYNATRKENYTIGELVEQHGKLYKCKKEHKADYQNMPNLDDGTYWQEVTGTGEVVEKKKVYPFYSSDVSYSTGDEVQRYGKNYKYIGRTKEAGKDPETEREYWELIEE